MLKGSLRKGFHHVWTTFFFKQGGYLLSGLGLVLYGCGLGGDQSSELLSSSLTMNLESSVFAAGGLIPVQYTCDGQDISLPLHWNAPPEGTQSFVLICDDPDAPLRTFVHWVVYNLPLEIRALPEGAPLEPTLQGGGIQGTNDFRKIGYGGPCPPRGAHRYFFRLYALDSQLTLQPGARKNQVIKAMEGCILASGELMGRYDRG